MIHHRLGVLQLSLPGPQPFLRRGRVDVDHRPVPYDPRLAARGGQLSFAAPGPDRARQCHRLAEMADGEPGLLRLGQQLPVLGSQLGQPAAEVLDALGQSLRRALLRVVCVAQGREGGHSRGVQGLHSVATFGQFPQAAVGETGVQGGEVGPSGLFFRLQGLQAGL